MLRAAMLLLVMVIACSCAPAPRHHTTETTTPAALESPSIAEAGSASPSLWARLDRGSALARDDHPRIAQEVRLLAADPLNVYRLSARAEPYLHYIVDAVQARGLPTEIALLPVIESGFRPEATSHRAASGLWQFIPSTARYLEIPSTPWLDGTRDLRLSTQAAFDYLEYLNRRFDGDWYLALAAYHAGEGTVSRSIARNRKQGESAEFWDLELPRSTQRYVPRLLAMFRLMASGAASTITPHPIDDAPFLADIAISKGIPLAYVADTTGLSLDALRRYNAGLKLGITPPDAEYRLLVPAESASRVTELLASAPTDPWHEYTIRPGDNLSRIAKRHGVSVTVLKNINDLQGTKILAGHSLLVPSVALPAVAGSYTVRRGDTLSAIARRHGVGYLELAQWNRLSTSAILRPGQELVLR